MINPNLVSFVNVYLYRLLSVWAYRQTEGHLYRSGGQAISPGCQFPPVFVCQKLWKLAGSWQRYGINYQAYFFGPPYMCTACNVEVWRSDVVCIRETSTISGYCLLDQHHSHSRWVPFKGDIVHAMIALRPNSTRRARPDFVGDPGLRPGLRQSLA